VNELLNGLGNVLGIVAAALAVIALAAVVYALKTAFGPLAVVLKWLFAYAPGNEAIAGISYGARMLVWAAVVAAVVWFLYQWS
jgi:hypothetical protein